MSNAAMPAAHPGQLRGVSETLLIPLAARARMARLNPRQFVDPLCADFLQMLGADGSRFERSRWTMAAGSARTMILDRELKETLQGGRKTVVVNLGAGLCSRYWRLGAPEGVRWIDVDLPAVIALKQRLIGDCHAAGKMMPGEWRAIAGDVRESAWMKEIEPADDESTVIIAEGLLMYLPEDQVRGLLGRLAVHYPGARMFLETWSTFVSRVWGWMSPSIRQTGTQVRWGLKDPSTLANWSENIRVLNAWSPGEIHPREWGLLQFAPRLRRSLMKIIELQFAK